MRLFTAVAVIVATGNFTGNFAVAGPTAKETASRVDALLLEHFHEQSVEPAPIANDEDFLRRVYLDLSGTVPSPREVTLFGLRGDADKRIEVIDSLLGSKEYAEAWGSYWDSVIFLRATEQRFRLVQPAFQKWMRAQLEANRPWDEIVTELITASGTVQEHGETGLVFAHTGQPEELAAEVSRIFLGIQMSCANCHDHPTDSWKRQQFHQLAAYFPRLTVRPEKPGEIRSFAVMSLDDTPGGGRAAPDPARLIRIFDRNRDGKLSQSEVRGRLQQNFEQILTVADRDKDGLLSENELTDIRELAAGQPGRGSREHYMPDLNNPAAQGTLMHPVFFVPESSGPRLSRNASDLERRRALANAITSPENPWFSRAFVNRIWGELLGQGFYMPIDDLGPERTALFDDVLETLSNGFVESGYDVKWLYRTITYTQAYQRQLVSNSDALPFSAAVATRLRSDQIYNSLTKILGIESNGRMMQPYRGAAMMRAAGLDPAKVAFSQLFGFDPSTPQADILGNIPQALFLMNSPQVDALVSGRGDTRLARILRSYSDDQDALSELYLLVLCRAPSDREMQINLDYLREVGDRTEACEDILWSLLNSTEFLSRR